VSPQFHLQVDNTFETVQGVHESTHGLWKEKCGFDTLETREGKEDGYRY
jgi:hypothetical protein